MSEWSWCHCGNPKSPDAAQCEDCFRERKEFEQVPVETDIDPVRDAFEWIIKQSRGEIS